MLKDLEGGRGSKGFGHWVSLMSAERAISLFSELGAFRMDLKALILDIKTKLSGYIFSIPLHEGSIDIKNLFAVRTNNLGLKCFG